MLVTTTTLCDIIGGESQGIIRVISYSMKIVDYIPVML